MRVLVCGGRDYANSATVWGALDEVAAKHGWGLLIVQGGAWGADYLARQWCQKHKSIRCVTVEAEWKKFGVKAGPLRNQKMLDEYKPELVLAFPGGRGTADMVRRAEAAGVLVQRIQ